jgi:ACS family tartrate transporter-like MFS transporter
MIALTIAAIGDMSTRGAFWTLPGQFLTGSALAAGIAFINTFGALGGFVGPTMVGYVREKSGSFAGGLLLLATLLAIAGVVTLMLRRAALLRE